MGADMTLEFPTTHDSEFVQFWNEVLAPKFIRFRHILVDGLTQHSEAIFPTLPVREGDRVLDVGCGFGDTAIRLADMVGPTGEVVGIDCCDAFLNDARRDAEASGLTNLRFIRGDAEIALPGAVQLRLLAFRHHVFRQSGRRAAQHAPGAATRRADGAHRLARQGGQSLAFHGQGRRDAVPAAARRGRENLRPGSLLDGGRGDRAGDDEGGRLCAGRR